MGQGTDIEIYRQRYETFRHLDKLRWQMLQILVAVGSISAVLLRIMGGEPEWWFIGTIGLVLIVISNVMFRIGVGIRANGLVLRDVGERIGDDQIPNISNKWLASSYWTAIIVRLTGIGGLFYAATDLISIVCGGADAQCFY